MDSIQPAGLNISDIEAWRRISAPSANATIGLKVLHRLVAFNLPAAHGWIPMTGNNSGTVSLPRSDLSAGRSQIRRSIGTWQAKDIRIKEMGKSRATAKLATPTVTSELYYNPTENAPQQTLRPTSCLTSGRE